MTTNSAAPSGQPGFPVVVTLASGAIFLSILDATVANLAVTDMHVSYPTASATDLTWVISLYAIVFAAFLAPAGRLADVIGRRALYTAGMGVFTVMSLLCAVAPNLPVLLGARALQGLGAAAMIPASLAVVLVDTPPARRAGAIGIWAAAASAAAAAGPSLGGILIDSVGWRSVFFINVPIGIALLVGIRVVPKSRSTGRIPDALGTLLLATGVFLLVLGVTEGPTWHWGDLRVLGSLLAGAVLLGLALLRSRRHPAPAVETGLWKNRTFALANLVSLFFGAALYAWMLIGALFLVDVWHYSRIAAGLSMSPGAILSAIVAGVVGRTLSRRNPRIVVSLGALAVVAAALWLALALSPHPQLWTMWLPVGLLAGLGMGAVSTGVSSAAALSVEPARFAGATGLNMAVRQIGGALGIAALAAILAPATPGAAAPYAHVVLFCCAMMAITALIGLGLSLHPHKPAPTTPAETPPKPQPAQR
ncbi:DHA2 family efflux MFS transporter permease subunit [Kitasatospora griseola]|uniref:DHA2 family efflux MFS transporter permease subunit n=1 Tax=Kitasatospora griseola TaxID=2064 RepID=UPI0005C48307|nr:DHA2 family efflux MFS transporter permease subunit [Kitasatospora griseola]